MRNNFLILIALLWTTSNVHSQIPSLDWSTTISGSGYTPTQMLRAPSTVRTRALAVDALGNFVVAGASYNGVSNEALIVKYNMAGIELWRNFARSATMRFVTAQAVAIDATGNIYVLGHEVVDFGSPRSRMVTIKFGPNGNELWRRSIAPQFPQESSYGIALEFDASGDLLVFGQHIGFLDRDGFLAVKYGTDGTQKWKTKVVKTTENITLFDARVSTSGEAYMVGSSGLVAKLSVDGNELWRTTLANQSGSTFPLRQIAIDSTGILYAVCTFTEGVGVLKVSPTGAELWRKIIGNNGSGLDSEVAVSIGPDGNLVVAGAGGQPGTPQFVTVKIASDGSEIWRNVKGDSNGGSASTVVVDASNNVFTGGQMSGRFIIEKYSPAGTTLWHAETTSTGDGANQAETIALRPDGGAIVAGTRVLEPARMKDIAGLVVDSSGLSMLEWRTGARADVRTDLFEPAVDATGNTFLTGGTILSDSGHIGAFAKKLNADGTLAWSSDLESVTYRQPTATRPQQTAGGDVVFSGSGFRNVLGTDVITRRLTTSGDVVWQTILDTGFYDSVADLMLDALDNTYVRAGSGIVKYSPSGNEIWRATASGKSAVTPQGELVTVGSVPDGNNRQNTYVARIDSAGQLLWQRNPDIGETRDNRGVKGALGPLNEVLAAGERTKANGYSEVFVIRFAPDGVESWRKFISTGDQNDVFIDMLVDPLGNIYVTTESSLAVSLTKFSGIGDMEWRKAIDQSDGGYTNASQMALDHAGNVYVSGAATKPSGSNGFWLSKVSPSGTINWRIEGAIAAGEMSKGNFVQILADGKILLTGQHQIPGGTTIGKVNRYSQSLGAPSGVSALPSDGKAYLYFSPPESDGGFKLSGYTATCNPGAIAATATNSPIVVNGLTNDTQFSCSVSVVDTRGVVATSQPVTVLPSVNAPLTILAAHSVKHHGPGGERRLPVRIGADFSSLITVEPRVESAAHVLELAFDRAITSVSSTSVTDVNGLSVGSGDAIVTNGALVVRLTSIPDGRKVRITLNGLNGALTQALTMGFKVGDVDSNGRVKASDIAATKANVGKSVNAKNFVFDTNRSGAIDHLDVSQTKQRTGSTIQ